MEQGEREVEGRVKELYIDTWRENGNEDKEDE